MICTFYSYKGGVGRSMALANVAELFCQTGLRVLVVDWDLEAPGLERFFPIEPSAALASRGVIDLLSGFKKQMMGDWPDSKDSSALPFESPRDLMIDVYPDSTAEGRLFLLTAGQRSPEKFESYANEVLTFDWKDFYRRWQGGRYFEWLRSEFLKIADVVLIDGRTGVTEMGGVCTYHLADVVAMFCGPSHQALDGTHKMFADFTRREVAEARGRPLHALVVPARIENAESGRLNEFKNEFLRRFGGPSAIPDGLSQHLWDLAIPYVARYAFWENVAVRERTQAVAGPIVRAYQLLTFALTRFAGDSSPLRTALQETTAQLGDEVIVRAFIGQDSVVVGQQTLASRSPDSDAGEFEFDVFVSYSYSDRAWVRGELLPRIEAAGLCAAIDFRDFPPGVSIFEAITEAIDKSRKILLVLTPDYVDSNAREELHPLMIRASRRVIPLLRIPCERPPEIASLVYVDFTENAALELGWRQLLVALGARPERTQQDRIARERWTFAHPYVLSSQFVGRTEEKALLTKWLNDEREYPLGILRALGGFGKSALVSHWLLHDVDPLRWRSVFWWSFYDQNSFEDFVSAALAYLGRPNNSSLSYNVQNLLGALHSERALLVLDGFERVLRAYANAERSSEQVKLRQCNAPEGDLFLRELAVSTLLPGKVLLTTRLRPEAVERNGRLLPGCREIELGPLQPREAVEFFHAAGIRGSRVEMEAVGEWYGYHPLSLQLLAGWIANDLRQPGDIAAARRKDVTGDLVTRRMHVLKQAYDGLDLRQQRLLSQIAAFDGPVDYDAIAALSDYGQTWLDGDLRELIARGLLHQDLETMRFSLHTIVRRYAYGRMSDYDRTNLHRRLQSYFSVAPRPRRIRTLADLAPLLELYHHMVSADGDPSATMAFFTGTLYAPLNSFGAYKLQVELLEPLVTKDGHPTVLQSQEQAWGMLVMARACAITGQIERARHLFEEVERFHGVSGTQGLARALCGDAQLVQVPRGEFRDADRILREAHDIAVVNNDLLTIAATRRELGRWSACVGAFGEAEARLNAAAEIAATLGKSAQRDIALERGFFELLRARVGRVRSALPVASSTLEFAQRTFEMNYEEPLERDMVRSLWLLGAALFDRDDLPAADRHLAEALARCRAVDLVDLEGGILIEQARGRIANKALDSAEQLANEALGIADRFGYVLQAAEAHLVLARLARIRNLSSFRQHVDAALRFAGGDDPTLSYRVVYDEANALLER